MNYFIYLRIQFSASNYFDFLRTLTGNKIFIVNKRRVFECVYANYIRRLLPVPHNARQGITFIRFPRLFYYSVNLRILNTTGMANGSYTGIHTETQVRHCGSFLSCGKHPNSGVGRLVVEVP